MNTLFKLLTIHLIGCAFCYEFTIHNGNLSTDHPSFLSEAHPSSLYKHQSTIERLKDSTVHTFFIHCLPGGLRYGISCAELKNYSHRLDRDLYLVTGSHLDMKRFARSNEVKWIGNVKPQHKISSDIDDSRQNTLDIVITLVPRLPFEKASSIMDSFLTKYGNEYTVGKVINSDRLLFKFDSKSALLQFVNATSHENAVLHIQRRTQNKLLNKYARGVLAFGGEYLNNKVLSYPLSGETFLGGLNGSGQIVGVGDTGADFANTFLSEKESQHPVNPPFKEWYSNAEYSDMISSADLGARKIIQYVKYVDGLDDHGHGTHVAASVLGHPCADTDLNSYSGMAPAAKLAFFDIGSSGGALETPVSLSRDYLLWAYVAGARIHTNSWGSETPSYTTDSLDMDTFIYNYPDMLVIVAAGNSGECSDSFFTVGSPATAKNVITVGATLNSGASFKDYIGVTGDSYTAGNMAYFSSMGPTSDFRLKPDVSVPGYYVRSADNSVTTSNSSMFVENLALMAGTSMSAPILAGAAALIREYFTAGFYPTGARNISHSFSPSASLLKAMIVNSASRMSGVKSSDDACPFDTRNDIILERVGLQQGYGRVQLDAVLHFSNSTQRFTHIPSLTYINSTLKDASITEGSVHSFVYCIHPDPKEEIRVSLVWTDPPASLLAGPQLVNDLDLVVRVFNESFQGNNLLDSEPDRINNVEGVYINGLNSSTSEELLVEVSVYSLGYGNQQDYSLVLSGNIAPGVCNGFESVKFPAPLFPNTHTPTSSDILIDLDPCEQRVLVEFYDSVEVSNTSQPYWTLTKSPSGPVIASGYDDKAICIDVGNYTITLYDDDFSGDFSVTSNSATIIAEDSFRFSQFRSWDIVVTMQTMSVSNSRDDVCYVGLAKLYLYLEVDEYPDDTTWILQDSNNEAYANGLFIGQWICVYPGDYIVDVSDSFGDGVPGGSLVLYINDYNVSTFTLGDFDYMKRLKFSITGLYSLSMVEEILDPIIIDFDCGVNQIAVFAILKPDYTITGVRIALLDFLGAEVWETTETSGGFCLEYSADPYFIGIFGYNILSDNGSFFSVYLNGSLIYTLSNDVHFTNAILVRFDVSGGFNRLFVDECPYQNDLLGVVVVGDQFSSIEQSFSLLSDSIIIEEDFYPVYARCLETSKIYNYTLFDQFGDGLHDSTGSAHTLYINGEVVLGPIDGTNPLGFDWSAVFVINLQNKEYLYLKDPYFYPEYPCPGAQVVVWFSADTVDELSEAGFNVQGPGGEYITVGNAFDDVFAPLCLVSTGNYTITLWGYLGSEPDSVAMVLVDHSAIYKEFASQGIYKRYISIFISNGIAPVSHDSVVELTNSTGTGISDVSSTLQNITDQTTDTKDSPDLETTTSSSLGFILGTLVAVCVGVGAIGWIRWSKTKSECLNLSSENMLNAFY